MINSNRYVLGFLFNPELTLVALIRKQRPEWQAGKLNGIGGKIEEHEVPSEAMQREFREETGVDIRTWRYFCTMRGPDWTVDCFCAADKKVLDVNSTTDEKVTIKSPLCWNDGCCHNVNWLIAMARGNLLNKQLPEGFHYEVFEQEI